MAKVSLEENSIQKIFHDLKDKYDHLIIYLHAKNETACTLKAHVELEKYKLLQMRYHDPQFNLSKLLALKERFLEHHKELTDDKESAHHLVEELESGIQTLDPMHNPLYQLEQSNNYSHEDPVQLTRHHLKLLNEFSHEVSTIYEELSEKLSKIEYSLGMFIQILENKKASVEHLKAVQPIQSTQRINPRSTR